MDKTNIYSPGDIVPFTIHTGIAVAAFLVSVAGATVALQLLHFQNFNKKWQYWLQLAACACSMGLVAVWCSHFIGYRALTMGNGETDLKLTYSPGLAAASCIIPIVSVFLIFLLADRNQTSKYYHLILGCCGVLSGLAIVGTHYVDCIAVKNYSPILQPAYIGGAVAIACFAGVLFIISLFLSQKYWRRWWIWRISTAAIVAAGISSVHFEAIAGTQYRLKYFSGTFEATNTVAIVAIVATILTLPVCIGIAYSTHKRRKGAHHHHKVMIACAKFDHSGRIMVNHDGLLPFQTIASDRIQRSIDELNSSHPDFQWFYRLSHSWCSIARLLPSMRRHLQVSEFENLSRNVSINEAARQQHIPRRPNASRATTTEKVHSLVFRENCCVAAADLGQDLQEHISKLGLLYDYVIKTGMKTGSQVKLLNRYFQCIISRKWIDTGDTEAERDIELYGNGALFLLVAQCDQNSALQQSSRGYLFVRIENIVDHLSSVLETPPCYLATHLNTARLQAAGASATFPSGILLSCFAIKPGVSTKSWDVIVQKAIPERLPCVELPICRLSDHGKQVLERLNGCTVAMSMSLLQSIIDNETGPESAFAIKILIGIQQLGDIITEPFFGRAVFCSTLFQIPNRSRLTGYVVYSSLLAFHVIRDMHDSPAKVTDALTYTSLSFFKCKHVTMYGGISSAAFERQIHKEFAALLPEADASNAQFPEQRTTDSISLPSPSKLRYAKSLLNTVRPHRKLSTSDQESVGRSISSEPGSRADGGSPYPVPFGGILVDRNVTMHKETRENPEDEWSSSVNFGTSAWAEEAERETQTWVDILYGIAIEHWQREERPHLTWEVARTEE